MRGNPFLIRQVSARQIVLAPLFTFRSNCLYQTGNC